MTSSDWYTIDNVATLDSPSLLLYKDRIQQNIETMIRIAGSAERLMPHVKTYKMVEVVQMQLQAGITKFKAATIAEAEMTAMAGASFVLIAHQLVGPKAERLVQLQQKYPNVRFASLVDCPEMAMHLGEVFGKHNLTATVFIDVNNGMNRTGHAVNDALFDLYKNLMTNAYAHVVCEGIHVYDGNLRQTDFAERKQAVDAAFAPVETWLAQVKSAGLPAPLVVCGGTPTFTSHALHAGVLCSPGTCLISDWGYGHSLPEQPFLWAGVLLTRVISKPKEGYITLDLGHKGVAAENPLPNRVSFLNLTDYAFVSQSEEHLVLSVKDWESVQVGDVIYGIPYHICPTINLYQEVYVAENQHVSTTWQVIARNRKITV